MSLDLQAEQAISAHIGTPTSPVASAAVTPRSTQPPIRKPFDKKKVLWYPMRATYSRELAVRDALLALHIESYVPMVERLIDFKRQLVPAISNLIFVRGTFNQILELKQTRQEFLPLRFMMHHWHENGDLLSEPIFVPDKLMDDFIRVSSVHDDSVEYVQNLEWACRKGITVEITDGYFAGVKGIIKRVHMNKCIVIPINGVAAIAVKNISKRFFKIVE